MKDKLDFLNRISVVELLIVAVLGVSFYGFIKYSDERFLIVEKQVEENNKQIFSLEEKYRKDLVDINNKISGAASSLALVIEQEQQKNASLKEEFGQISLKLNTLAKLSATDKELLKKYSKNYFLNEHYVPISLTTIDQRYLSNTSSNSQIHSNVLPYLQAMLISANNEGAMLKVQSAYRSFTTQSGLKSAYSVTYGAGTANKFSADQGYSEHQLGTTVDFTTEKTKGVLSGFDKTPEYEWLLNNAYRFGFVISYPKGNSYYIYEPWHWRFVGIQLATRIRQDNTYFYNMDQRVIDSYLASIFD
ncbi:MAG: M15 family metallopeptidase [Patescibacteria group bacterium]